MRKKQQATHLLRSAVALHNCFILWPCTLQHFGNSIVKKKYPLYLPQQLSMTYILDECLYSLIHFHPKFQGAPNDLGRGLKIPFFQKLPILIKRITLFFYI